MNYTIRVSNSLDCEYVRHSLPDLCPGCLQRLSADDTSSQSYASLFYFLKKLLYINFILPIFFGSEDVCLLCMLQIFKCILNLFYYGDKQYATRSDCSLWSSLILVHKACNIGNQSTSARQLLEMVGKQCSQQCILKLGVY